MSGKSPCVLHPNEIFCACRTGDRVASLAALLREFFGEDANCTAGAKWLMARGVQYAPPADNRGIVGALQDLQALGSPAPAAPSPDAIAALKEISELWSHMRLDQDVSMKALWRRWFTQAEWELMSDAIDALRIAIAAERTLK